MFPTLPTGRRPIYRDDGERVSVYSEGLTVCRFDEPALETVRDVLETAVFTGGHKLNTRAVRPVPGRQFVSKQRPLRVRSAGVTARFPMPMQCRRTKLWLLS